MKQSIENRVALVTGASKGIGKAIAQRLALDGARVVISARNEETLKRAASELSDHAGRPVDFVMADVTHPDSARMVVEHVKNKHGRVDILVNNAGGPRFGNLMDLSETDWDEALQLSLRAAIRFTRQCLPLMKTNGWGRIVNITSTVAKEPSPAMILSATARAGLHAFSKALSFEIAPAGITINTICPGGVLTDRLEHLLKARSEKEQVPYEALLKQSQSGIPIGRFAAPDELAAYAAFLCSDDARYITGTCVSVDGGLTKAV